MRISRYFAALSILAVAGSQAWGQEDLTRDLSVVQSHAHGVGVHLRGSMRVSAWVDREDLTYAKGERVKLFVQSNEDAFVTVVAVSPSGQVTQLFPNRYQAESKVRANQTLQIPAPNSESRIEVSGPSYGAELIKVIASNKPIKLVADGKLEPGDVFANVRGGVDELVRDLVGIGTGPADGDLKVGIVNKVIKTLPIRGAVGLGGPAIVLVPASAGPPPAAASIPLLPAVPAGQPVFEIAPKQPFPLLVAVDRPVYHPGERVTLAVTSLQACHLTIIDISTSGNARVIFPNKLAQNNSIGTSQTALVSGGTSPIAFEASGAAGTEQIIALCSTDPSPVISASLDFDQLFTFIGPREAVARDLAVVPNRPVSSTAIALGSFTVQP